MKKIYFLFFLCCLNYAAVATKYYPTSITAPYGGTAQTVCIGSLNTATTVTYTVCGTTATGTYSVTPTVYLNGVVVYTGTPFSPAAAGGTLTLAAGSFTYTTAGTFTGTNGLECVLTWTGASPGACGAVTTVTGASTNITVTATPPAITGPTAVCIGNSISLSDVTTGGTWSSSSSAQATVNLGTGVVTGAAVGAPTISYGIGGCIVTATVTVSAPPAAVSGATSVCILATTPLSDATGGGTWTSSNLSAATVGSTSGIVTGVSAGPVTITYNTTGGCMVTNSMTVVGFPVPITGPASVCKGSTIALSEATAGGIWSSASTSVATVGSSNGIVTGVSPNTSVITYSNGCGTAQTTTITVNQVPAAITGIKTLCISSTTQLSDATTSGTWSSSNISVASISATGNVTAGGSAGVPTISYTLSDACMATTTLNIYPGPASITGPSSICKGLMITLNDLTGGGTWSSSNTTVASLSGISSVTGVAAGTAIISYSNGCGPAATTTVTVNSLPLPITGNTRACVSLTTTLSDVNSGGIWSSNSTSIIATVNSSTGVVTGVAAGTAPITYTLSTTCMITATVTVVNPPGPISGIMTVCAGQKTTLSDNVSGGYWSSSNISLATVGSSNGVVTGASLGMPVITYTMGSSCFTVATVTVNPLAPITGIDSVCKGSTTYLADIVGGGTWASSLPAIASIGSLNGFVTGVSTGVAHITYTTSLGCITTTSMAVIAVPPGITGTMKTCPGATTTLHDATNGGIWSSDNNGIATVSTSGGTGTVYGVNADTTTIHYIVRPGCSVSTLVTVNPLPAAITGFTSICATITDSLQDATPGGVWSTTTGTLATINDTSGVVTALSPGGNAVIVYTLPTTGCKITDTVLIYPLPVPTITYNWITQSLDANTGYTSYQWYDSLEGLIPGATAPTIAALYTEYYYVVVTDSAGCTGTSALYEFNVAMLGVNNPVNTLIKINPNPATTTVYIESPVNVRAVITGIDGKKQMDQADAKEIDVSRLSDGMYFITLYNDDRQVVAIRKLIKQ